VHRQPGAGAQAMLAGLLAAANLPMPPPALVVRTEAEVAGAILDGKADVGLGLQSIAQQFRLDFIPLGVERFDLLIWRRAYFDPGPQALFAFARSPAFHDRAQEMAGYEVTGLGRVHFNGS